jgi:RimJ/RimL family protein N-acetyltransferase
VIDTERLILRRPEASDVDDWPVMLSDPEVARFLGPPLESREAVAAHIEMALERYRADGFGLLTVVRKDDGRVIGRSGFLVWDKRSWPPATLQDACEQTEVEIGWTLARDCWGLGYATEAGAACRDYGIGMLGRARHRHGEGFRGSALDRHCSSGRAGANVKATGVPSGAEITPAEPDPGNAGEGS